MPDANYTHTTEDPEKKKQAFELFHELINREDKKKIARDQAQDDYERRLTEIEVKYDLTALEHELAVIDPLGIIREEYNIVQKKLLS